jgi:hypothetical protein
MATATRVRQPQPPAPAPASLPVYRLSVEQYHRLIESGVFRSGDRVELLDGILVSKMTHNPPHAASVVLITRLLSRTLPDEWLLRAQLPVTTRESEPEPDFALVPGPVNRYGTRHPVPREVGLLIEVADTSLAEDQGPKLQLYARARIAPYWIVNLVDRRVEVYTQPRGGRSPGYRHRQDYGPGEAVPLVLGGQDFGTLAVSDLLP